MTNHWQNLFEDRTAKLEAISDEAILEWIREDNYSPLAPSLEAAGFDGWVPDLENLQFAERAFDREGFALDGSGWVAFNYKPFPSTFWPTNGSTDDVMIRLPQAFRSDASGAYSRDVYVANLAILELTIKDLAAVGTPPIDERRVGKDLDGDGALKVTHRVNRAEQYVGAAAGEHWERSMYPAGTEFLHTVRYLGIGSDGHIGPSTRLKEVRYMRKWVAYRARVYERVYQLEGYDKELGALPSYHYLGDKGLDNKFGWSIQGFIENPAGDLRAATYEENLFCMGCHTSMARPSTRPSPFRAKLTVRTDGATSTCKACPMRRTGARRSVRLPPTCSASEAAESFAAMPRCRHVGSRPTARLISTRPCRPKMSMRSSRRLLSAHLNSTRPTESSSRSRTSFSARCLRECARQRVSSSRCTDGADARA